MSTLTVGVLTIPVAVSSPKRDRLDLMDRARAFDGTYRASATGNPKREWTLSTPPITREAADLYESALNTASPVLCSGDLIGGSSNLLLYSEQTDNAAWTKSAVTISANAGTAPNNTQTADKMQETAVSSAHAISQAVTCALGQYTLSIWVTAAERTKCIVSMTDATTGDASIGVDLTNGTTFASGIAVGSWTGISSTVSASYGGWYRISITGQRGAGTQTIPVIYIVTSGTVYLGVVPNGIFTWGAQLEAGPGTASYTPTTSAAVSSLTTSCYPEITGWTPVRLSSGYRVVLDIALYEA